MAAGSDQQRQHGPRGEARIDTAARWGFWISLATLAVVWTLCVYMPDREILRDARARKAQLLRDVSSLTREVKSLTKGAQLLEAEAPYLWERVVRVRLNWIAPGERRIDEEQ